MHLPVFVSAAAGELDAARELVVGALADLGFSTRVSPPIAFPGEGWAGDSSGTRREELRGLIEGSGAVIQLVGFCCGPLPLAGEPGLGRLSDTQFEARLAERLGKRVLYVTLPRTYPFAPVGAETDEQVVAQLRYRKSLRGRGDQWGPPATPVALRGLIQGWRSELEEILALASEGPESPSREPHEAGGGDGAGLGGLKTIVTSLRRDLAAVGREPSRLSQAELEIELIRRVPRLTGDDLQRLVGYALFKADYSRLVQHTPPELFGRVAEIRSLNRAWTQAVRAEPGRPRVITIVAQPGAGKSSIVAAWVAAVAQRDWPGWDAVFAWSFSRSGGGEPVAASADLFFAAALEFFGDAGSRSTPVAGLATAQDQGRHLARLVGRRRTLLLLDGVEALQGGSDSPQPGLLRNEAFAEMLLLLAAEGSGLCVVTTRTSVADLRRIGSTAAPELALPGLPRAGGVALLRSLKRGPRDSGRGLQGGPADFERVVAAFGGHALSLQLMGSYLLDARDGDLARRGLLTPLAPDGAGETTVRSGPAPQVFRILEAMVDFLGGTGIGVWCRAGFSSAARTQRRENRRALATLRLLGLFDRPATAGCLEALRKAPVVPGLTDDLVGITEAEHGRIFAQLERANLLRVNREVAGTVVSLDAHPLVREFFSHQVRGGDGEVVSEVWRAGHRRLYEHLSETVPDLPHPTLEDLQPLYQTVFHGCQAGLAQEAYDRVYRDRILRGDESHRARRPGSPSSDLGALACFFEPPWSRVSPRLNETTKTAVLNATAGRLRALGRLTEALATLRAGLVPGSKSTNWEMAARWAGQESDLELILGDVPAAVTSAEAAVAFADRSGDAYQRESRRVDLADALHQAGRGAEAALRFGEAEALQAGNQPHYPLLTGIAGYRYADLLLSGPERAAARPWHPESRPEKWLSACRAVEERGRRMLEWRVPGDSHLEIALEHLALGRAILCSAVLGANRPPGEETLLEDPGTDRLFFQIPSSETQARWSAATSHIETAVDNLRQSGHLEHLPRGLLTRAWLRRRTGPWTGPDSALADLEEAWALSDRGPLPLFQVDIHLSRVRLFAGRGPGFGVRGEGCSADGDAYPWDSPQDDLAAARRLIVKHGYRRRLPELEDAEAGLAGLPRCERNGGAVPGVAASPD